MSTVAEKLRQLRRDAGVDDARAGSSGREAKAPSSPSGTFSREREKETRSRAMSTLASGPQGHVATEPQRWNASPAGGRSCRQADEGGPAERDTQPGSEEAPPSSPLFAPSMGLTLRAGLRRSCPIPSGTVGTFSRQREKEKKCWSPASGRRRRSFGFLSVGAGRSGRYCGTWTRAISRAAGLCRDRGSGFPQDRFR
jgi:hypothetical protein